MPKVTPRLFAFALFFTVTNAASGRIVPASVKAHASNTNRAWSIILEEDNPGILLNGNPGVTELSTMESRGLTEAKLKTPPWSDTYWPLMYGGISWRFGDRSYPKSKSFAKNYRFFDAHPLTKFASPAEKYDRLVGDDAKTLTHHAWSDGLEILKEFGKVLDWEGLCHGWSVASFSESEPRRSVSVRSVRGETVLFTPSDIKALTSQMYAKARLPVDFVGTKCLEDKPAEDSLGRSVDDACLTTNPAAWHLTVVNRIAVMQRSFVIDVSYDGPVWNQPVTAYRYSYFNPQTLVASTSLAEAAIPVGLFSKDKFREYRTAGTAFIVGIEMEMTYVGENEPSKLSRPRPTNFEKVRYVYDLELDQNGKLLGGEWYSRQHPDFMWAPKENAKPMSIAEEDASANPESNWNGTDPLPEALSSKAKVASSRGQPVYAIIKTLLDRSALKTKTRALRN